MKFYLRILLIVSAFQNIPCFSQESMNVLTTAVPFLVLQPNSRIGSLGEIGCVSSSFYRDAGLCQNPALLSKNSKYFGVNVSYLPWLRNLVHGMSVSQFNIFSAIDSTSAFGMNLKYFSHDERILTSVSGAPYSNYYPNELALKLIYNHSFANGISAGVGLKYIRSDLISGTVNNEHIRPAHSFAVDIGISYEKTIDLLCQNNLYLNAGTAITNFGPRIHYTDNLNAEKNFIPTNLSLGILISPQFYLSKNIKYSQEVAYQTDKLLIPTPPEYDENNTIVAGKNPDISPFKALYSSFYDAPGGFSEEIHEFIHKFGFETRFTYKKSVFVAFRYGKFLEHLTKGNRKFNTMGIGIGTYGFTLDWKKILPVEENTALRNTQAISLGFRSRLNRIFSF